MDVVQIGCTEHYLYCIAPSWSPKLPHLLYSPDLLSTGAHFFKYVENFLSEKCVWNQIEDETAFSHFFASRILELYEAGIKLFLIGRRQ